MNAIIKLIITQIRIPTAGMEFGRHRSVFLSCYRGVDGSCAKHLTIEFYIAVMLLTFILFIVSIPSPLRLLFRA